MTAQSSSQNTTYIKQGGNNTTQNINNITLRRKQKSAPEGPLTLNFAICICSAVFVTL